MTLRDIYLQWDRAITEDMDSSVAYRVMKIYYQLDCSHLEKDKDSLKKFEFARRLFVNKEYQRCYEYLGQFYGKILSSKVDLMPTVLAMNIPLDGASIIVSQELTVGKVVNIELLNHYEVQESDGVVGS